VAGDSASVTGLLHRVADEFGTPSFVYLVPRIRERAAEIRAAFGNRFQISYAVKSNPNPALLRALRDIVDRLDVSSGGEVATALACAWPAEALSFTGPAKSDAEIAAAVAAGIGEVIVESVDECEVLDAAAASADRRQRVLVRISPAVVPRGFGSNMSGKPSQFGIDEEVVDQAMERLLRLEHIEVVGFHVYSGTQCLNGDAIVENYATFVDIFTRVCATHGIRPEMLVFGSGLGIPYYETDTPLDLGTVGAGTLRLLDERLTDAAFAATRLVLEIGRYLVGEAGIYLTRIVRIKSSRGVEIGICDGGMNHHLGAAGHLGSVVPRNYRMFKVGTEAGFTPERSYNLVGPLCTTIDTLARNVKLGELSAGDLIGIHCSGAYGVSASPIHFISHAPPREVLVDGDWDLLRLSDVSQFRPRAAEG